MQGLKTSPTPADALCGKKKDVKEKGTRWSQILLGFFAVVMHALACFFYTSMARLHAYIKITPAAVIVLSFTGVDLLRFFNFVIAASIGLASLHALAIFGPCYWWFTRRRSRDPFRVHAGAGEVTELKSNEQMQRPKSLFRRIQAKLQKWDRALEHKTGADSYEFLAFVEIGLQTYQAQKMSRLVATQWINRLMVLAIIANCWFMPAVSFVFRKKPSSFVKVVHLALDAVIEIVYGMAIPLAIFSPYYRDAPQILTDRSFIGHYSDTWLINAVAENLQLYVSSWVDFVSKMSPGLSLLLRLFAFEAQRAEHETRSRTASLVIAIPGSLQLRKKRIVNGLLALWGFGVLAAHLSATAVNNTGRDPGCLLEPVPLGSTRYSCAVMEVSCSQKSIFGTKSEIDTALSRIDPLAVRGVIFSHCESLSMPPRLKTFANLVEIKIHNCSIAEWGADAALTAQEHPLFKTLYITMTNMSRIPDGLLAPDPPPILNNVQLCGTNLTGIPDDLFDTWATLTYFYLELSPGITKVPRALRNPTSPRMVSVASNGISSIPDDFFVGHQFWYFIASGNPLTRLPENVGQPPYILSFAFTDVSTMPASWVAASARFMAPYVSISGQGTPLCSSLGDIRSQSPNGNVSTTLPWVRCGDVANTKRYFYPLETEKQWRERNRV